MTNERVYKNFVEIRGLSKSSINITKLLFK